MGKVEKGNNGEGVINFAQSPPTERRSSHLKFKISRCEGDIVEDFLIWLRFVLKMHEALRRHINPLLPSTLELWEHCFVSSIMSFKSLRNLKHVFISVRTLKLSYEVVMVYKIVRNRPCWSCFKSSTRFQMSSITLLKLNISVKASYIQYKSFIMGNFWFFGLGVVVPTAQDILVWNQDYI